MKYRVNKGFIIQKIDDKTVIFDEEESMLFTLNETASEIFRLMKKGIDKKEIVEKMVKKYAIKKERVEKDFNGLVTDLKKMKIISV